MATARCLKDISGAVVATAVTDVVLVVVIVVVAKEVCICCAAKLPTAVVAVDVMVLVSSPRPVLGLGYINTVPLGAELAIIRVER